MIAVDRDAAGIADGNKKTAHWKEVARKRAERIGAMKNEIAKKGADAKGADS